MKCFSKRDSVFVSLMLLFLLLSVPPFSLIAQDDGPDQCPGAPTSNLVVGARGHVTSIAGATPELHTAPTLNSTSLTPLPEGSEFEVIAGPVCADEYSFWLLAMDDGTTGWAPEGIDNTYWLESVTSPENLIALVSTDLQSSLRNNLYVWLVNADQSLQHEQRIQRYTALPNWTSDGQRLWFMVDGQIQFVELDTHETNTFDAPAEISTDQAEYLLMPDSHTLIYAKDSRLISYDIYTGMSREILEIDTDAVQQSIGYIETDTPRIIRLLSASPNGQFVLIDINTRLGQGPGDSSGFRAVADLQASTLRAVIENLQGDVNYGSGSGCGWSPDSLHFACNSSAGGINPTIDVVNIFSANGIQVKQYQVWVESDPSTGGWVARISSQYEYDFERPPVFVLDPVLWSPDGRFIAFPGHVIDGSGNDSVLLIVIRTNGSEIRTLAEMSSLYGWLADSGAVVYQDGESIKLVFVDSGENYVIAQGRNAIPRPNAASDAEPLAFQNILAVNGRATVFVINNDTLSVRQGPGLGYRILERLPIGTEVTLRSGPESADGYVWWNILTPNNTQGWVVEYADGIQTLVPSFSTEGNTNTGPEIVDTTLVTCSGASNCSVTCGDGSIFEDACPANGQFASCENWQVEACRDRGGVAQDTWCGASVCIESEVDGSWTGAPIHQAQVIFINGIHTSPEGHEAGLENVYQNWNAPVMGIYNSTDGFVLAGPVRDGYQSVDDWLSSFDFLNQFDAVVFRNEWFRNPAISSLVGALRNRSTGLVIDELEIVAHSQGAIITTAALRFLSMQGYDLSNLTVTTLGGAGVNFPEGPSYHHYAFCGDPVATVFAGGLIPGRRTYLNVDFGLYSIERAHSLEHYLEFLPLFEEAELAGQSIDVCTSRSVIHYYPANQYDRYQLILDHLGELRNDANQLLNLADLLLIDVTDSSELVCATGNLAELDAFPELPPDSSGVVNANYLCMAVDIAEGVIKGIEAVGPKGLLTWIEVLINADKVAVDLGEAVDELFLDDINRWAWSTPITCAFFPDSPTCPPNR